MSPADLHRVLLTTVADAVVEAIFFAINFVIYGNWVFGSTLANAADNAPLARPADRGGLQRPRRP